MEISFTFTIANVGTYWRVNLVQTIGELVIPEEGLAFDGKSVAAAVRRADDYIGNLELDEWTTAFDFASALAPHLQLAVDNAYKVREEADHAEYQMVRTTHRAIDMLLSAGFGLRDTAVFLGRSKSDVHRILQEGRLYEEAAKQHDALLNDTATSTPGPDFERLFEVCSCNESTCTKCSGFQLTPRTAEALYAACQLLADQAFDDVEYHNDARVADDGGWSVFDNYPRITWTQDREWRHKAARSFDDLASDIASGEWPLPRCPSEEMALHLTIELAKDGVKDQFIRVGSSLPAHRDDLQWDVMSDVFLQDEDILELFDPGLDGVEDPENDLNRQFGIGDYRSSAWFTTFANMSARDNNRGFRR